ncbi:hypothetical protein Bca101_082017 [Brassica carinata]
MRSNSSLFEELNKTILTNLNHANGTSSYSYDAISMKPTYRQLETDETDIAARDR